MYCTEKIRGEKNYMKNKLIKRLTVCTLIATVSLTSMLPGINAYAASKNNNRGNSGKIESSKVESHNVSKEEFDEMNNEIAKYLILNDDGTIALSEKTPRSLNKYDLDALKSHLEGLNEEVTNGEIIINSDLTIVEKSARGNVSKAVKYWWGYSNYYSYKDVNVELKKVNNMLKIYGTATAVTGIFSKAAGIIFGLGALYWGWYSADLSLENSMSDGQGVVADVNFSGVYSIYRQW